jgi:hypothetical protein
MVEEIVSVLSQRHCPTVSVAPAEASPSTPLVADPRREEGA